MASGLRQLLKRDFEKTFEKGLPSGRRDSHLLFFISGYGIGIGIAAIGGVEGALGEPAVLKAVLGTVLTAAGYSSMALLAAFATRNAAGAIAIVLGYIMLVESLLELMCGSKTSRRVDNVYFVRHVC